MSTDALRRIDAVIQIGLRLARSAPSGRVLLARVADAIDPAWIPQPWGEEIAAELAKASGAAREPLELRRVEKTLRDAWGAHPTDELDEFEPEPVAVTPSSQVHRGVLDGAPVAIKILRPGLASSVRQDLLLIESLTAPLSAAFPALDAGAVVREFRERVLEELDLEHEATVQRRFHRALRGHPTLTVPAPITRLAHDNVLVSEWVDGVPLWQASDPDQAAARLLLFVLGAARFGLMHADPTPDDVLVLGDGRLAILDFGATRAVDPRRVELTAAALDAYVAGDVPGFGTALARLGALGESHAGAALELARETLADLGSSDPVRLDSDAVLAARERLFERTDTLIELILAGTLAPQDLWPARGAGQLFATIARVGASGAWVELSRAALRDGWEAQLG